MKKILISLLICISSSVCAYELPEYLAIETSIHYSQIMDGGYDWLKDEKGGAVISNIRLTFTEKTPVISELAYTTSFSGEFHAHEIQHNKENPSYRELFIELKSPFKTNFLSHETTWFLQFMRSSRQFSAVSDSAFILWDSVAVLEGSDITFGQNHTYFAVAIDTPFETDSFLSHTRFGLFYFETIRGRSANVHNSPDHHVLKIQERFGGFFYNFRRPVVSPRLTLDLRVALGFGTQSIKANTLGLSSGDFNASSFMASVNTGLGVNYRYPLTERLGISGNFQYNFETLISLSREGNSSIKDSGDHKLRVGLTVDYYL